MKEAWSRAISAMSISTALGMLDLQLSQYMKCGSVGLKVREQKHASSRARIGCHEVYGSRCDSNVTQEFQRQVEVVIVRMVLRQSTIYNEDQRGTPEEQNARFQDGSRIIKRLTRYP